MPCPTIIKLFRKLCLGDGSEHDDEENRSDRPENNQALASSASPRPLTILEKLPTEIITYVARFLPLSSMILFGLTCHTAYNILGTSHWPNLWDEGQDLQHVEFLSQLGKDLPPEYVPCFQCRALHKCTMHYADGVPTRPLYQHHRTECSFAERLGKVSDYISPGFQFRTFQMAMKMHRMGCDSPAWVRSLCNSSSTCGTNRIFSTGFDADAKIVENTLLFRTHLVMLIPPGLSIQDVKHLPLAICPHIKLVAHGAKANLPGTAECTMNHKHTPKDCVKISETIFCAACPTEYELKQVDCGRFGVLIVITKWMDLGEGRTIFDPKWWSHLSKRYTYRALFKNVEGIGGGRLVDRVPVQSSCVSIRDTFEQGSEQDAILPLETQERLFGLPKLGRFAR